MPVRWEQDDERCLITLTVSDPYTVDDIMAVVDRQAAAGVWEYALLYDLRAAKELVTLDPVAVKAHMLRAGGGRPRGASALVVGNHPEWFVTGLRYSAGVATVQDFEVLITPAQVDDWIHRHARGHPRSNAAIKA